MNRRHFLAGISGLAVAASMPRLVLANTEPGSLELRAVAAPKAIAGAQYEASDLWLFNGETPGPEIRVKQGDRVRVRFINELDEPTSIHWHGIRIENSMDGVSGLTQEPVQPGGTFDYEFTVPDAGTFWYHAHNKSWSHVARGLYGPLIVDEVTPTFDREHDLTLMIDDWRLSGDGSLDVASLGAFMDWSHAGRLGNWVTVNGRSEPRFDLKTGELYRIRLVNAANARIFYLDPKALGARVIALDGFNLERPREPNGIMALAPAQRVDLLIGSEVAKAVAMTDVGDFALQELSGRPPIGLATFDFTGNRTEALPPPPVLRTNVIAQPDRTNAIKIPLIMSGGAMGRMGDMTFNGAPLTREIMMEQKQVWAFNGVANMPAEPMFAAARGQTFEIETVNQTGWAHAMHVHGHHFRVVARNGKLTENQDWRDTFFIDRDETVTIAFVADNPGKWMLHCHMLEHAAAGMRTWFSVA